MAATNPKPDLFIGQNDLTIVLESKQDISTATLKEVLLINPKGVRSTRTVTRVVNLKDAEYDVQPGDFTVPGQWNFQLHTIIGGKHGYSKKDTLIFQPL